MGTNFYVISKPACKCCGREYEDLHIGKSSAGWCFALHVIPEEGINDLEDWKKYWKGKLIKDEYGRELTKKEMLSIVTNRKGMGFDRDCYAYASWEQFHKENYSEPGPNGLLRCKIGHSCIGHGEGTWDLITGEFS